MSTTPGGATAGAAPAPVPLEVEAPGPARAPAGGQRGSVIFAWCLFDWSLSAFNTIIGTFIFSVYFAKGIVGDETAGGAAWATAAGLAGIAVAILSPVLGAVADHGGRGKPWLAVLVGLTAVSTAMLWWAAPSPDWALYALLVSGFATVAFELCYVFYNAMLPGLAPPGKIGRISGWGWGLGYLGGLVSLALALFGLVGLGDTPPLLPLPDAESEHIRATVLLVAVWMVVFSIPLFVLVPDRPRGLPFGAAVKAGMVQLGAMGRFLLGGGPTVRFLIASMLYLNGITTLTALGGLYASGTFGLDFTQILIFAIGLNVTAGLGAALFAFVDDWVGSKPTILIALCGLVLTGVPILLLSDPFWFIALALGLGLFFGPAQAAGRTMMARLAPPGAETEMFGLYALSGRATSFIGPLAFAAVTTAFDSQRAGMTTVVVLFVLGGLLLITVPEPPRRAAPE